MTKLGDIRCAAIALALAVGAAAPLAHAQSAPPAANKPAPVEKPAEKAGDKEGKSKGRGLSLPNPMGGKDEIPTARLIDTHKATMGLRTQSGYDAIGAKLAPGQQRVCEDEQSVVQVQRDNGFSIDLIADIVRPLGLKPADITFEWVADGDTVNCNTLLKRKNTFRCTSGLLNVKVPTDDGNLRPLNRTELGFIFAHEIAHILLGHDAGAAQAEQRASAVQSLATLVSVGGALAEARWTKDAAGNYTATMGPDSMQAFWLGINYGATLRDASCELAGTDFAKDQETEADYLAIDLLIKAGLLARTSDVAQFLAALKTASDTKGGAGNKAFKDGAMQLVNQAMLEGMTGTGFENSGLGTSMSGSAKQMAVKVAFGFYKDYKTKQGLAFHPDPAKRTDRLNKYLAANYADFLASSTEASLATLRKNNDAIVAAQQRELAAIEAAAVIPKQLRERIQDYMLLKTKGPDLPEPPKPTGLSSLVKAAADAPKPTPTPEAVAKHEAELAAIAADIESLRKQVKPSVNAECEFALASYAVFKRDMTGAKKFAVNATTMPNAQTEMFTFAVEQIFAAPPGAKPAAPAAAVAPATAAPAAKSQRAAQAQEALAVLARGAALFSERPFYPQLIRTHTLLGDKTRADQIAAKCVTDLLAPAQTRQACGAESAGQDEDKAEGDKTKANPLGLNLGGLKKLRGGDGDKADEKAADKPAEKPAGQGAGAKTP